MRSAGRLLGALLAAALATAPLAAHGADACAAQNRRAAAKLRRDARVTLADLGVWVDVARYGQAWQPCAVGPDWRPYFHGSWSWTADGWFWVSEEPWGWATYHYGRWYFDSAHGWVWLPGKTWAPAWVRWRWNDQVVGWAPLEPAGTPHSAFWTFVPAGRLSGEPVESAAIPGPRVPALLLQTKPSPSGSTTSARVCSPAAPCPSPRPLRSARSTS